MNEEKLIEGFKKAHGTVVCSIGIEVILVIFVILLILASWTSNLIFLIPIGIAVIVLGICLWNLSVKRNEINYHQFIKENAREMVCDGIIGPREKRNTRSSLKR